MGASIEKVRIDEILEGYNPKKNSDITIATIGSHTAQQIVQGAKDKGFRTLLIIKEADRITYEGFAECRPDEYIVVKDFKEILKPDMQDDLRKRNAIIIPHGSFVAYVGGEDLLESYEVPMLGNRKTLYLESSRKRQKEWLHDKAGIKMPRQWDSVEDVPFGAEDAPKLFFVKYSGAPGGKGFFTFKTKDEFLKNVLLARHKKEIKEDDNAITIQEYIPGNRHYLHFFATPFFDKGLKVGEYNLELLSEDRRDEAADELHRIGFDHEKLKELGIIPDFTVIGNIPLVLREKLIGRGFELGKRVLESSVELVGGMMGPFCLETVVTKDEQFYCFEISTRIVAGTNLYTKDCPHPYTVKTWGKGMSHGDRIALEIEEGIKRKELHKIIY